MHADKEKLAGLPSLKRAYKTSDPKGSSCYEGSLAASYKLRMGKVLTEKKRRNHGKEKGGRTIEVETLGGSYRI